MNKKEIDHNIIESSEASGSSTADLSEKTEKSIRAEDSEPAAEEGVDSISAEDSDPAAEERGDSIPAEDSDPSEEDGFGDGAGEPAENDAESKKIKRNEEKRTVGQMVWTACLLYDAAGL